MENQVKKKRKKILRYILIVVLFILVLMSIFLYKKRWDIQFEEVAFYETNIVLTQDESLLWFSLRHSNYHGFYSVEYLRNYGVDVSDIEFDFDNYTYIFTIGHELMRLEYSYSQFKNRRFLMFPKQLIGIVTLDEGLVNKVFVYKINRMDIDLDYHAPRTNVYFSN
jgi:hypothetical protein